MEHPDKEARPPSAADSPEASAGAGVEALQQAIQDNLYPNIA